MYQSEPKPRREEYQQNYCASVELQLKGGARKEVFENVTLRVYANPPRVEIKTRYNSVYVYNMDSVLTYYMELSERDFNTIERGV